MKNKMKTVTAVLLVLSMMLSSFYGVKTVEASGNERVFRGEGYCITLRQQSSWADGFTAEAEVQNTSGEKMRNWQIDMGVLDGTLVNVWNAEWKQEKNKCTFDCKEFNRVIQPGQSISFGYQMEGASFDDVELLELTQKSRRVHDKDDYTISYRIVNQWEKHAVIEADIYNYLPQSIQDWKISFEFAGKITNIWNADILSENGSTYEIQNKEYNAEIPSGGKVTFGFEAEFSENRIVCPEEGILEGVGEAAKTPEPETPSVEDFDPETDACVYQDVENMDWNREMIHADAQIVEEEKKKAEDTVRVALLDSGVNYSDAVYVSKRKNFVPGEDDYSLLFEDGSGHGTAIAEVLAADPDAEPLGMSEADWDDVGEAEYFDEEGNLETTESEQIKEENDEQEDDGDLTLGDLLDSGYKGIKGINPGVDLYSAKILDAENETTVERVVKAIDWAIENDSDIISMSFGMPEDSEELHEAVQKAARHGILMIAAAGNGDAVDYPAAYPEVMAVGAVDSMGKQAAESASGEEIEVAAPGEFIVSRGWLDSLQIFSGTSMAVPQVTGLASILWQKDTSRSAGFIRQLINATARECGDKEDFGNGIIDCEYALEQYDEFAQIVQEEKLEKADAEETEEALEDIENQSQPETFTEVRKLYGRWAEETHENFVSKNFTRKTIKDFTNLEKAFVVGSVVSDDTYNPGLAKMSVHPEFHGYYKKKNGQDSNYIASYLYLVEMAEQMYNKGTLTFADCSGNAAFQEDGVKNAYDAVEKAFEDADKVGSKTWKQISSLCQKKNGNVPKKYRSLLIYGMALHTITDVYAHSSFCCVKETENNIGDGTQLTWRHLNHQNLVKKDKKSEKKKEADAKFICEKRFSNAKEIAKKIVAQVDLDDDSGTFNGYTSNASSVDNVCGTSYYDVRKQTKAMGLCLSTAYLANGYAINGISKYVGQAERLQGKSYPDTKEKVKGFALGEVKKVTENYVILREKFRKKSGTDILYGIRVYWKGKMFARVKNKKQYCCIAVRKDKDFSISPFAQGGNAKYKAFNIINGKVPGNVALKGRSLLANMSYLFMEGEEEEPEETEALCGIENHEAEEAQDAFRIELTWGEKPADLDVLFSAMFPEKDNYMYLTCNVAKTENRDLADVFQTDETKASLDCDDTDSYGPETLTLHNMEKGGYYFFVVRNYTADSLTPEEIREQGLIVKELKSQLSNSGATVKVYRGNDTEPVYVTKVPEGEGYFWNVFCIWGETGQIIPLNTITDEALGD